MFTVTSTGSWISAIFDEIALEGLEGTTLPSLWTLLLNRLKCGDSLPAKLQQQIWTLLLRSGDKVSFYELPEERPLYPPYDRSKDVNSEIGMPVVPDECPFLRYPYAPIEDENIMGNCADYKTRKAIDVSELRELTAVEATDRWQQKLVVVASQEQRLLALKPPNVLIPKQISVQQYIFLESVGRSRWNGETTSGKWSLASYFKDASIIFYIKNYLIAQHLVTAQHYAERSNNRSSVGVLVTLPRFFTVYKSLQQRVIEKLYVEIQRRPDHQISTTEIPDQLDELSQRQVKVLLLSHQFRKFFETVQLPHPSNKSSPASGSASKKPRTITVMRLRNPELKFEELSQSEGNETKEEKFGSDFLSLRHAYVDMPLELECLRAISRYGARGLSMTELAHYVAINFQNARMCIKYLVREGQLKDYSERVGKTRTIRYVAGKQAVELVDRKREQLEQAVQQLQCQEEPTVPQSLTVTLKDLPEIQAKLRRKTYPMKVSNAPNTQRDVERKSSIVQQLDRKCLIHTSELLRVIKEAEENLGCKERICRKSLFRLLEHMQLAGIVNVFEVTLQYHQAVRLYRFVTHPKIGIEHAVVHREVLRLKSNLYYISEELKQKPSQQNHTKRYKDVRAAKKQPEKKPVQSPAKVASPKLLLAYALHEFLYYLLMEQRSSHSKPLVLTEQLLQQWQLAEPSLQTEQYLAEWQANESHILPYTEEISWRTFIPPLPVYEKAKPPGWLYFVDAVERLPLSMLMRLFCLPREDMDALRPHLQHPVRQHYLPQQLQLQHLVPRVRVQQLYTSTLRMLNNMGLIQVSERQMGRDPLQRWVYLNRHTSLLDTTTSRGHNYNRVSTDVSYKELPFVFETREQVADYWEKLQHICVYTKLGFRQQRDATLPKKLPMLKFVRDVDFEEAVHLDDGTVPGDRRGAAGLSSLLFAHQMRHWSWVKHSGKGASSAASGVGAAGISRKRLNLMRLKAEPKITQLQQRKKRAVSALVETTRKRKAGPRDDIDRDALRNMRTLRVTWSSEEDRILKMGRAIYLFIDAPLPSLALFNVGTICRDVIRQHLGICNKTSQACVRRLQFLLRMKRDLPDVPNWIYMMQTQPQFSDLYNERFVAELKREYPLKDEQNQAMLTHFVLLFSKLQRMINSSDNVQRKFMLPDNLEDYERQFRECVPLNGEVEQLLYANPSTETELQVTVAMAVMHCILCSAKDKALYNLQAFEIYKHFSEEVLNAAFNKARSDSLLVAVKRRNMQTISRHLSDPAHLLSSKYRNRLMCQRLGHVHYDAYYAFDQRFHGQQSESNNWLSSPNIVQLLWLGERLASHRLNLSLQLPANILTVDTSSGSRSSASASDRILDHYSSIFDNAPQTEYSKRLESEYSGRQSARVRFHPGNITYRLPHNVYNQLSKLPLRAMHFFCALDSLGQSVLISRSRLEQGECPFGCIMRSGNYLNAVERISYEHRPVLKQLTEDALPQQHQQPQLQLDSSTRLTISTSNLLTVAQQMETCWRLQQHADECKDLGKTLADRTQHKLTDWLAICSGLLEIEAGKQETDHSADYEPSLNKEERARAQDVFVVHLPTIQLSDAAVKDEKAEQKAIEELRRAVLDKVSRVTYWNYTNHTFETLLPVLKSKDYDGQSIEQMELILGYIEERPLGVEALELRRIFPFGKFLLIALHELEDHELIKRVGVANHMYVHKHHIREWMVHTFHIKRLERERVQQLVAESPATPQAVVGRKRKAAADAGEEQPCSSSSKQVKLVDQLHQSNESSDSDEHLASRSARRSSQRVVKQKQTTASGTSIPTATSPTSTSTREVIVMRPQPWIRANASLNRRVLDRWLGAILSECISRTGCTVHSLFLRFCHLVPVDIMLLLELLCDLDCILLMEFQPRTVHVEEPNDDELKEEQVTELYDANYTYVKTHSDAIRRLTNFIGLKKYSSEFI